MSRDTFTTRVCSLRHFPQFCAICGEIILVHSVEQVASGHRLWRYSKNESRAGACIKHATLDIDNCGGYLRAFGQSAKAALTFPQQLFRTQSVRDVLDKSSIAAKTSTSLP